MSCKSTPESNLSEISRCRTRICGPSHCPHGHTTINYAKWNGSFKWGLSLRSIRMTNLGACIGISPVHILTVVLPNLLLSRYLQLLTSRRVQHLKRIQTFMNRRLAILNGIIPEQEAAMARSQTFHRYDTSEASATRSFADGIFCVGSMLCHLVT